jgi:4-hydroxy-2-oxoheptanedioate aldolase
MPKAAINPIRAALSSGQTLCGPFQVFTDGAITEIAIGAGFDYVLIDAEHRALNPETIEKLIRTAQGAGGAAMVRPSMLARGPVQYILDSGADAILIPLVNSRAQAEEAVSLCRFPPHGSRGLNSGMRNANWGAADAAAYAAEANRELVVAVQIETVSGLNAVDEIAAVPGVDMLYVGPTDLSHSMGLTGQLTHSDVRAAMTRIFEAGKRHKKWLGVLAVDTTFAKWCMELGVQFLTYKSDVRFMKAGFAAARGEIKNLISPNEN